MHLVYDLEIKRAIRSARETPLDGIAYCEGWNDHANMGISVLGALEWPSGRAHVFCDDNKVAFGDLYQDVIAKSGKLISFNGIGFDNKVLKAAWGLDVPSNVCYDLLRETWLAAGLGPEFIYPTHAGYGLDAICRANAIPAKIGSGSHAPIAWQQGRIGEVIDYCLNDCYITGLLFDATQELQSLTSPKDGRQLVYPKVMP